MPMNKTALAALLAACFATAPAPAQAATILFAVLNGANECDNTAAPAGPVCIKGDPDGIGSVTIISVSASLACFAVTIDNVSAPAAMHIHSGGEATNGPVVIALAPIPASGNPGTSSGCVGGIAAGVLANIRNNPDLFYVNVHTPDFPGGAVRGQLF